MRTDMTKELSVHALQYIKALCNEGNHDKVALLTQIKRLIDVELNLVQGNDPMRNR